MSGIKYHRTLTSTKAADLLLVALLFVQVVPLANACLLPAAGVAMAFVEAEMPGDCGVPNKNACLMAFLQADQAPSTDAFPTSLELAILLALPVDTPRSNGNGIVPLRFGFHSSSPPPHVLFCRMLK